MLKKLLSSVGKFDKMILREVARMRAKYLLQLTKTYLDLAREVNREYYIKRAKECLEQLKREV